jgi:acetolactate synthase regulatory subunit
MSHTLLVRLKKAEGSLIRLLGQIGRRGYEVLGVSAKLTADKAAFDVVVEFEPFMPAPPAPPLPRPAEVLPALVAKLEDVVKVELKSGSASKPPPAEPPGNGSAGDPKKKAPAGKPGEMHWEE